MLLPVYILLTTTMTLLMGWMSNITLLGLQGLRQRNRSISFSTDAGNLSIASYCEAFMADECVEHLVWCSLVTELRHLTPNSDPLLAY